MAGIVYNGICITEKQYIAILESQLEEANKKDQLYPTAFAYEQVCRLNNEKTERIRELEAELNGLKTELLVEREASSRKNKALDRVNMKLAKAVESMSKCKEDHGYGAVYCRHLEVLKEIGEIK